MRPNTNRQPAGAPVGCTGGRVRSPIPIARLKCKLDAAEDDVFLVGGGGGVCRTAAPEGGGFEIKVQFEVAVKIPIQARAPGGGLPGRSRRGVEGEGGLVQRQLADARDQFERAPSAAAQAEWTEGDDVLEGTGLEGVFLAGEEIGTFDLPGGVVKMGPRSAGHGGRDRLAGENIFAKNSERTPVVIG